MSLISQSTGAAGGLSTRLEKFEGFGAASTPYFLQFEPLLSRPITIKVNGILQVQGVDYVFDGANPSIFYFTRFMDPSQKIDVVYTPKPTQSVEGDRRVFGADYLLPVGRYGSLNYSIAKGELLSSVNPSSGIARNFAANLHWKKLVLRGHVNSIPQQFVSVENRSFNRNERATQLELGYDWRGLTSGLSHQNSAISIRRIDVNGTPFFQPGRTTLSKAFASRKVGGIDVSLSQTRTSSVSSQSDNQLDATALSASKRFGNVTFTSSMDHQTGYGLIPVGNILTRSNIRVDSVRLGADFSPRGPWTYSAKTSLSSISAGSQSGVGHDILFTGVYRGSGRLQSEITYADSDSGELATLGTFTTGQGLGYDGNGFSSGVSGVGFTGGATNQRLAQIHAAYKLNDRIDLDGRLMTSQSAGSVTSNTQRNSYGVGLEANLGGGNLASLSVDHSSTNFIGSLFKSNSTSLDFSISGFPGRWNYRLNTSLLLSGGNSSFAQNNYAFDASVTRFLSKKQSLSLSGSSGRTTGYYSQNDATASLTYQYQLWNNVALGASYRWRKVANLGQQNSGGAYRSNSFDLSLNFNFGR